MKRLNDEFVDIEKVKRVTQSLTDAIFLIDTNHKLNELNQKCLSDKLNIPTVCFRIFFYQIKQNINKNNVLKNIIVKKLKNKKMA